MLGTRTPVAISKAPVNEIGTEKPFSAIRIVAKKLPMIKKKNKPTYNSDNETFRFPKYLPALDSKLSHYFLR